MIIYELECSLGHRFEGWFPSSEAFEVQCKEGLVHCAICGLGEIKTVPAGGYISHSKPSKKETLQKPKPTKTEETVANIDPITMVKMVDHYVKTNFKNVGDQFAKKALEIHQGTTEKESIYGTATPKEQEVLVQEEVPFVTLPKLPESTEN